MQFLLNKMRKDYQDLIKRGEMQDDQMANLMKEMGRKWSHLEKEEKDLFIEAANQDKDRYEREMKEFNIQGAKGKTIQDFDSQRPKKCLSAYMIFVRETRPIIVKEQQETSGTSHTQNSIEVNVLEVMKEVGRRWKSLSNSQRLIFENKAKEDKKRFDKEMSEFNKEINKVNISLVDSKTKVKVQKKSKKGKVKPKAKQRKRNKKAEESYTDYYYPSKTYEAKHKDELRPKNDYSLRRRNRTVKKEYLESESEEYEEEEEYEEAKEEEEKDDKNVASMPKKPLSSYIFFSQQVRDKMKKDHPNMNVSDLMKEISHTWAGMNTKDKEPYNDMAKNDKSRYEHELEDYKKIMKSKVDDFNKINPHKRGNMNLEREMPKRQINEFSNKIHLNSHMDDEYFHRESRHPPIDERVDSRRGPVIIGADSFGKMNQEQPVVKRERRTKKNFDYMKEMPSNIVRGQNVLPINPQERYRRNKNINPSTNFEGPPQPINWEGEEYLNPNGSEILEGPSIYSNNKIVVNEDKLTERSKQDSINFGVGDDEVKDWFLNKEISPDNDLINPFGRTANDPSPNLFEEAQKMSERQLQRQDSSRLQQMESAGFGGGNVNEINPQRPYFSTYKNMEGINNDGFLMPMSSFKSNDMDFIEGGYNRSFSSTFGPNNYPCYDFKFSQNNYNNQARFHQNSFNNPFMDPSRADSFGPDFGQNPMNQGNNPYPGSMNPPMNYFNYPPQKHNYFYKKYPK